MNGPDFTFTNGLTVTGWMTTSGTADFAGLVDKFDEAGQTTGFEIGMSGNNGFPPNRAGIMRADLGIGSTYVTAYNLRDVADGTPHHFALTCDGRQAILYVDGVAGTPVNASNWIPNNAHIVLLGADNADVSRHFRGQLDEVTIYSRVLSSDEVQALFRAVGAPTGQQLAPAAPQSIVGGPGSFQTPV